MRLASTLVAASVILMTVTGTATAQAFFTPFVGYNFGGDSVNCASFSNCDDKRMNIGMSFGSTGRFAGTEQELSYVRHFFDTADSSGSMVTAMSNFLVIVPAGPVRPYGVVGIGLLRAHSSVGTKNSLGYDIGGGVNVFFTSRFGLRADVRRMRSLQSVTLFALSGEKLEFWRASLGVTFRSAPAYRRPMTR
jgi:opacity protein-like surface antigen